LAVLDHDIRSAILTLAGQGCGVRAIARAVQVDRKSVRKVLAQGVADVPEIERAGQLDEWLVQVRDLHRDCKGNLVRVHEELLARHGVDVRYSTLTRFCRDAEIGVRPKKPSGRYEFAPGQEMQHDTSPHQVKIDSRLMKLHCASLVMCFSRRRFVQYYPRWTRFHARVFLTAALKHFGGSSAQCMLDNSTVILLRGTGPDAVVSPEMVAFGQHFGFEFIAHEKGDANRSARVEGPFWHVENNFLAGREFVDLTDLNMRAITWCQKYDAKYHKSFAGIPNELWAMERSATKPLPDWVPDPVEVHVRHGDAEGYINLHTNRYSVRDTLIEAELEVHETADRVRVYHGRQLVAEHDKRPDGAGARVTLPEHRGRWRRTKPTPATCPLETALRAGSPALSALCDVLHIQRKSRARPAIQRLHRMWIEYPGDALERAVQRALEFGLADLERIERMTLQNIRGEFFRLPNPEDRDER
jgi:transposase